MKAVASLLFFLAAVGGSLAGILTNIEEGRAVDDGPVSVDLVQHLTNPMTIAAGVVLDISFLVFLWLMVAKPGA